MNTDYILNDASSFIAIHPGSILKDELEERNISQKEFADSIGLHPTVVNDLIKGKRNITVEIALLLEAALGIPANNWLKLQSEYDLDLARVDERNLQKQQNVEDWKKISSICNTSAIAKVLGGLPLSVKSKIDAVLSFFSVESVNDLQAKYYLDFGQVRYRKSEKVKNDPVDLFTWKYICSHVNRQESDLNVKFKNESLEDLVNDLNTLFSQNPENLTERIKSTLNSYGIKYLEVKNLPKTHIEGCSFWQGNNPTVVITRRQKWLDVYAFDLMHEICHVYRDLTKDSDCSYVAMDGEKDSSEERVADTFASSALIPTKEWKSFIMKYSNYSRFAIKPLLRRFAKENGVNEAIVAGRYGHEIGKYDFMKGIDRSFS